MPKRTRFGFYLPGEDGRPVFVPKGTRHTAKLAKQLEGNPDAFEDYDDTPPPEDVDETPPTSEDEQPTAPSSDDGTPTPPAGNASTEEWRAFASKVGVELDEDAGRDDIKAALSERGLIG